MSEKPSGRPDSFLSRHRRKLAALSLLGAAELGREALTPPAKLPPDNSSAVDAADSASPNTIDIEPSSTPSAAPTSSRPTERTSIAAPVEHKTPLVREKTPESTADQARADLIANLRQKFKGVKFNDWVQISSSQDQTTYLSAVYAEAIPEPDVSWLRPLTSSRDFLNITLTEKSGGDGPEFVIYFAEFEWKDLVAPVTFDDPQDLEIMVQKLLDLLHDQAFNHLVSNYVNNPSEETIAAANKYLISRGFFGRRDFWEKK